MFPKYEEIPVASGAGMCADGCGALPPCAPLAVPNVPFQPAGARKYDKTEALANGTLFPGLNLPFHRKVDPGPVPNTPLAELQALEFVLVELGLYLDTHKDDHEAFLLFQKYAAMEKEAKARYEALHGPLTLSCAADDKRYEWTCGPWPWNAYEGGTK